MDHKPFVVYRSSAGSGKTFTLAFIFLKLVLSKKDTSYFRHVMALTFTVKAAEEMKHRILSYLSDLSTGTNTRRKESTFIQNQLLRELDIEAIELKARAQRTLAQILHNYSDFQILTIDKFITRLTKSFASDLALSPDFEIEIDSTLFVEKALQALYDEVGTSEKTTELVSAFLRFKLSRDESTNLDDPLRKATLATLNEEFFFLEEKIKQMDLHEILSIKEKLQERITLFDENIKQVGSSALNIIHANGLDQDDFAEKSRGVYTYFLRLKNDGIQGKMHPPAKVLKNVEEDKWMSGTKNEAVLNIKDDLVVFFYQAQELLSYLPEIKLDMTIVKELFTLGFIGELSSISQQVKEEENIKLLSDLSRIVAEQFGQEQTPFIFERLGNRIKHLLIDEFQDTSNLQWMNLLPLIENALSEGNETLIVGDAKQSIYRFRGSEPQLFNGLPDVNAPSKELFKASYKEERLEKNFRSAKKVIEFNNRLFASVNSEVYPAFIQSSYQNHEQQAVQEANGEVRWEVLPYERSDKNAIVMHSMKERLISLLQRKEIAPGEVCCLFRTRSSAAKFASELLHEGYNVISEDSLLLTNNPKVNLIISTIEAFRHPKDPFLTQRWLSRFHHYSPLEAYHELAQRTKKDKWSIHQLWSALKLPSVSLDGTNSFSTCCAIARALSLSFEDAFVSRLLDVALEYEVSNQYLQTSFIEHWNAISSKTNIALPEGKDAIRVMTIHKSKGLEFPTCFVFMPELKVGRKRTKSELWVDLSEREQIGMMHLNTSDLKETSLNDVFEEEDQRSQLDFINTLYVAFTRAEKRLEIFSIDEGKNPNSPSVQLKEIKHWPEWNEAENCLVLN